MPEQAIYAIPGFSEPFSSLTHLIAAAIFLGLGIWLLFHGGTNKGRFFSLLTFVVSAVFLLAMSGTFHLLEPGTTGRAVLQRLDHAGIFLLIAGSITAVHGTIFKGIASWGILLFVWCFTVASITLKTIYFNDTPEWLGLSLYLGLGWVGAVSGLLLYLRFGFRFIKPLLYGGIAYTLGAIIEFVQLPALISGVVGAHELFHIAVLIGLGYHMRFIFRVSHPQLLHNWFDRKRPALAS